MEDRYETAWRTILMALGMTLALMSFGQGKFTINGRLKAEGGDLSGARAVVYKNGEKERTITSNLSKFSVELDLDANYVISFEKEGYVTKKLSFNTKVPADARGGSFTPFDYAVSLFKQYDDINIVVFNQPVGVIRYDPGTADFDYDTDYTKSIQSQLQKVMAEVDKRQKEESRTAVQDAKQKAAEEKARAKAEAEERKQAEAALKEEQRREAEARKAEEERRRAEEARMAQQEAPPTPRPIQEPEPIPVAEVAPPAPKPLPAPKPALVRRNALLAETHGGEEGRRGISPVMGEEASRVAPALAHGETDERPEEIVHMSEVFRNEQLIVEPNKVMTIVELERDGRRDEYRKVIHKWGDTFYFKNGKACSAQVYQQEAMADRMVAAMPRD